MTATATPITPSYLRLLEAAVAVSVGDRTIRRAVAAGCLPAVRLGRELRLARADLEAWASRGYPTRPADQPA